jgi:hypothetical protein
MEHEERVVQYMKLAFGVYFAAGIYFMLSELCTISRRLEELDRHLSDQ